MSQTLLKWLVPLGALIVALALAEVSLRLFFPVPYTGEKSFYFEPDPYTGHRIRPNTVGEFPNGVPAIANSFGHNDDEVELKPPAGVYRILLLGDSFTMGTSVRRDAGYPQVLERILKQQLARNIEVINAGVGGWEPFQYAQYYEHYGQGFEPDLVLIGFFVGNDTYRPVRNADELTTAVAGRRVSRQVADQPNIQLLVFLYEHSHLGRLAITRYLGDDFDNARKDCEDFAEHFLRVQERRLKNQLAYDAGKEEQMRFSVEQIQRIKKLASTNSVPTAIILIPDENQINTALQNRIIGAADRHKYDFDMPQKMLSAKFQDLGIPTVDLLPAFRNDSRCLYSNDTHWTSEGHALAAEFIAAELPKKLGDLER